MLIPPNYGARTQRFRGDLPAAGEGARPPAGPVPAGRGGRQARAEPGRRHPPDRRRAEDPRAASRAVPGRTGRAERRPRRRGEDGPLEARLPGGRFATQVAGISGPADLAAAVGGGATHVGFPLRLPVHSEDCDPREAAALIATLPAGVEPVLITYLETAHEIVELAREVGARPRPRNGNRRRDEGRQAAADRAGTRGLGGAGGRRGAEPFCPRLERLAPLWTPSSPTPSIPDWGARVTRPEAPLQRLRAARGLLAAAADPGRGADTENVAKRSRRSGRPGSTCTRCRGCCWPDGPRAPRLREAASWWRAARG